MSKTTGRDADFSAATRTLTAERAGYRCSLPTCSRITVGPGMRAQDSVCTGKAAHIYSAAAGGPRGTGGLTPEERKSPANAIWLCGDHADLVDKNRGTDYPAELLLSYKALHEAQIARELGGLHARLGWVEKLTIHSSPLFKPPTVIEFGKLTLLVGMNEVGKTALCEWLAAVADLEFLTRWQWRREGRNRVDVEITYRDPEPHVARLDFSSGKWPRYLLDREFTAVPTAPVKIIFPGELRSSGEKKPDDLEFLATVLGMHPYEVLALCEEMRGTDNVTRAWFEEDEDGYRLHADVRGISPGLQFRGLSGSERVRVMMEFAIVAANRFAGTRPTVLILDSGGWGLDTSWLKRYGEVLSSPTIGFQTLACIPTRNLNLEELQWAGWKVIRLEGRPPEVALNFEVRTGTP